MIRHFYNCLAPLLFLANYRRVDRERLQVPKCKRKEGELYWIHAISVGETKAAAPLARALKKRNPKAQIVISSVTKTGFAEAKRSLPELDCHFRLPLDTPRLMKKLVGELNPTHFFLVETDLWPNLLHWLKKNQTKCHLVSAKMSARSFKRHKLFPPFAKYLLNHFDHICLQSEEHKERFSPFFNHPLKVTGNLKWDNLQIESQPKREDQELVITLGSTHPGEEKLLLEALKNFNTKIYVLPRHPNRFPEVATLIKNYPNAILIDKMGVLCETYAKSDIAIVGGSFVSGIGGHNIFEPLAYSVPVIFGPHMWGQKEMAKLALESGAGAQGEAQELPELIEKVHNKGKAGAKLLQSLQGATERTLKTIF